MLAHKLQAYDCWSLATGVSGVANGRNQMELLYYLLYSHHHRQPDRRSPHIDIPHHSDGWFAQSSCTDISFCSLKCAQIQ